MSAPRSWRKRCEVNMSRPTRLQLEETIERFEMQREDWPPELTSPFVLIDELRALQEELEHVFELDVQRQKTMDVVVALNNNVSAALARIEALCDEYDRHPEEDWYADTVAKHIRAALRGEP